jgi:hypothetical protein
VNGDPLPPRLDLFNHSPAGFDWGYGGSGPAQLALAMLADALVHDAETLRTATRLLGYHEPVDPSPEETPVLVTSDEIAVRLHQRFKEAVIARLSPEDWEINIMFVRHLVRRWEKES